MYVRGNDLGFHCLILSLSHPPGKPFCQSETQLYRCTLPVLSSQLQNYQPPADFVVFLWVPDPSSRILRNTHCSSPSSSTKWFSFLIVSLILPYTLYPRFPTVTPFKIFCTSRIPLSSNFVWITWPACGTVNSTSSECRLDTRPLSIDLKVK